MLINAKSVKAKIKEAGLRSKPEAIITIDKKVNGMIDAIIARAKQAKVITLKQEDVL